MKLQGKTALITGGTSGIGLATAKLFINEGARVAVTGRDESRFAEVRNQLGSEALIIPADVRSTPDLQRLAHEVESAFGDLNIFFANAGIALPSPLASTDESRYDEVIDTNIKGVFFSMQAVAPLLADGGSVILVTSFLNRVGRDGLSLLSASKAAVRSLARTWSRELLPRRIRVNAVSPGAIDTPLHARSGGTPEQIQARKSEIASRVPIGRLGRANEIAQAVLYLASDDSRYVIGTELVIDGGISQL
ncbi:SDR family oxidoreductase [Paraburkholderia caribensis]|uniref:SDR family oxidoreductase n=1 Tax=Paraburkholderia caribensis TaxID=75105 RepID=UPI00078CF72D|nr:SDR family oxidoreductase [Paraburkholderia caribensis]AMV48344.1 short-chain dehydrogenase [Paraburkholderia caribensis]